MPSSAALLVAIAVAIGTAACGGGDSADPLTLEQRLPGAAAAPGSKPDPVETRRTAVGLGPFETRIADTHFVNPTPDDLRRFRETGFVRAISDTRFFPERPGGQHRRTSAHLRALLMEFRSGDGAEEAIELVNSDSQRPCPGECAVQVEEFDPDVAEAKGVRRYATAARLEALGEDEGRPFDSYAVQFADGRVAYAVELFGPPGTVSAERAAEIADALYERVHGAPLPTQ